MSSPLSTIPPTGIILVFGAPGSGKDARVIRALLNDAEKSHKPIGLYGDCDGGTKLSLFFDPKGRDSDFRQDEFAQKILREASSSRVVFSASGTMEYPTRTRDFLFMNAVCLVTLKNSVGDQFLDQILSSQRSRVLRVLSVKLPTMDKLNEDGDSIILVRSRKSATAVFSPQTWTSCRRVKLPIFKGIAGSGFPRKVA